MSCAFNSFISNNQAFHLWKMKRIHTFILLQETSETDNVPKKSMKKQVSFGDEQQISYDAPVYGGYAHAAVKVAKRYQGKNKRRTFELILRPDNFHIDLVVENPAGYCTSIYDFNPNDEVMNIENLNSENTD